MLIYRRYLSIFIIQKRYAALNIANDNKELGNIIAIHENIRAFLEGVRIGEDNNLKALIFIILIPLLL